MKHLVMFSKEELSKLSIDELIELERIVEKMKNDDEIERFEDEGGRVDE